MLDLLFVMWFRCEVELGDELLQASGVRKELLYRILFILLLMSVEILWPPVCLRPGLLLAHCRGRASQYHL